MPTRIGKYTLELGRKPVILGFASVVGKKESEIGGIQLGKGGKPPAKRSGSPCTEEGKCKKYGC